MPLNSVDFVPKGPIRSADIQQFVNLFTGVMLDQPVAFKNSLTVGGAQGATTAALSLFGAPNQTSNLLNLYPNPASLTPTFGFAAYGQFGWGAGGQQVQDTFLSRIATQNGHAVDTAGLLITPMLEVPTLAVDTTLTFVQGNASLSAAGGVVSVANSLQVDSLLYLGVDKAQWLYEVRAGQIMLEYTLSINNADAAGSGLTLAPAHLQVRGDNMPDTTGAMILAASFHTFAGNWLQFNPKFFKVVAGQAWPQIALLLDYDVDNNNTAGGRIGMMNQKISLGGIPDPNGTAVQTTGAMTVNGGITMSPEAAILLWAGDGVTLQGQPGKLVLNSQLSVGGNNSNTPGAMLVFPQAVGPKICIYDAGSGIFFGMGINSAEMYLAVPANNTLTLRNDNSAGLALMTINNTGMILATTPTPASNATIWLGADQTAIIRRQNVANVGDSLSLTGKQVYIDGSLVLGGNPTLTFYTPNDPQGGGQVYRVITVSTRPASQVGGGEIHMGLRLFLDGDITSGTNMHAISFQTTSDPRLKSAMTNMSDVDCMARIRNPNVHVYTYTITPPVTGGFPQPTAPDIGFDATEVYAASPEFTALDSSGAAVAVAYGNMSAMLWGALRSLDARCQAKGI